MARIIGIEKNNAFIQDIFDEDRRNIFKIIQSGKSLNELDSVVVTLPVLQALSEAKRNLLIWYPFKNNTSVLEIGAGYGTITRLLTEKASHVTVVESNGERARLNYTRNKDCKNLDIIVGNLDGLDEKNVYDYIVIHDEYDEMFQTFSTVSNALKQITTYMSSAGRILFFAKNALSIHQFNFFLDSVVYSEKQNGTSKIRITKNEIIPLCNEIGLNCTKIYYPYPNLDFPTEIFTDRSINSLMYGRPFHSYDSSKIDFFNERKMLTAFVRGGIADQFADAFLIEMTKNHEECESQIEYVKLSTDRNPKYQIYTVIWEKESEKKVSKIAAHQEAIPHIKKMISLDIEQGKGEILSGYEGQKNEIIYPFLKEKNLDDLFFERMIQKDWNACLDILEKVFQTFLGNAVQSDHYFSDEFCKVFGNIDPGMILPCKSGMDIDLILDNVFICGETLRLIDTEWVFDFEIPVQYIMWRIINEVYHKYPSLTEHIKCGDVMEKYGISSFLENVFRNWEMHFLTKYVGNGMMLQKYAVSPKKLDIQRIIEKENGFEVVRTTLYIDIGKGFNETDVLTQEIPICNQLIRVSFDLSHFSDIRGIRWDPIEEACVCSDYKVFSKESDLSIRPYNSTLTERNETFFSVRDPIFIIDGSFSGVKTIEVSSKIEPLDQGRLLEKKEKVLLNQKQYIDCLHNSKIWFIFEWKDKLVKKYQWQKQKIQLLKDRIKQHVKNRYLKKQINIFEFLTKNFSDGELFSSNDSVDVIVPIYNGYEYLTKLFPCLLKTHMSVRILLIDDCSTDPRVHEIERVFSEEHKQVFLIKNEENMGFVKTVNIGFQNSENHVALVNTDTELPELWLERLMRPILENSQIASTTPFSNSATIFSFPNFCYNNEIYREMTVDEIDGVFAQLKPRNITVPTGVGFCMGLNRKALREIGEFDYEAFSKGYGEENDWCQRAVRAGYRNVQVENLFVYHKHGGSFMSEEKSKLLENNLQIIKNRYPDYDAKVAEFIRKDVNKDIREAVQMMLDCKDTKTKSVLAFDHNLGGGATSYLNQQRKTLLARNDMMIVIRYDYLKNKYKVEYHNGKFQIEYYFDSFEQIMDIGAYLHFDEIWINELVTYPNLENTLSVIHRFAQKNKAKLIMLFHDYFALCPTINLMSPDHRYCNLPDGDICNNCFTKHQCDQIYGCENIRDWQKIWESFLIECDEVRTFSQDTFNRVEEVYGSQYNLTLVPHRIEYLFPIQKSYKTTKTINIGLLGFLSIHKGALIIEEMLQLLQKDENTDVNIVLIGESEEKDFTKYSNFSQTGRYQSENLVQLIYENDIDIFFISSVWPETFSYTTEEIMKMGMPVACFNIGAPALRVKAYEKGIIIHEMTGKAALSTILSRSGEYLLPIRKEIEGKKVVYIVEYVSFSSRYRIEHLKEELFTEGVKGEIWKTDQLPKKIDWSQISKIIIYRCRDIEPLTSLIKEIRENHISIWYDIDDLIFDYSTIKELDFLEKDEYQDFHVYSKNIYRCIEKCNGIITSTEMLKKCLQKKFPQKKIIVNRNRASSQMMILSNRARLEKTENKTSVILGYFSGSHTHDGDFAVISDVIFDLLKNNSSIKLMIVGCLQLSPMFNQVNEQISRMDFVDWKKLPEIMAKCDVNLMPLQDTLFHSCKSENKWMEAAFAGIPTIASYNDEIAGCTKDGENILLCRTTMDWYQQLHKLVHDEILRKSIAKKALDTVQREKSTLYCNEGLYHGIFEANI